MVALALIMALLPMNSSTMCAERFVWLSAKQLSPCTSFMPMAGIPMKVSSKNREAVTVFQSRSSTWILWLRSQLHLEGAVL